MTALNKKLHALSPAPQAVDDFSIVDAILRNQGDFFAEIRAKIGLSTKIAKLFIAATYLSHNLWRGPRLRPRLPITKRRYQAAGCLFSKFGGLSAYAVHF